MVFGPIRSAAAPHGHICGLYYTEPSTPTPNHRHGLFHSPALTRKYLTPRSLSAHTVIVSSTARTTLTQTFINPNTATIPELHYSFPLYDGVSVVGFRFTINNERVVDGVVQERAEARQTYQDAVDRGETAALLEQLPSSSDVFTTTVGNVPAGAKITVELAYLGELKQDAEVDGLRFTLPTHIAPRYGSYPGELASTNVGTHGAGLSILVDVEMPQGCTIRSVQSPSHPIGVSIGSTSTSTASEPSLLRASATLSLGTTELAADFVLHIVAAGTSDPTAVLETHPTMANHRALAVSLVPRFSLPSIKPEIVFLCDRSGSMEGDKMAHLKTALQILLRSIPVGAKFDICSFGSRHEFLFDGGGTTSHGVFGSRWTPIVTADNNNNTGGVAQKGSRTYDADTLRQAQAYVETFGPNFGGTEIFSALEAAFERRHPDMELEVVLLTDGEVWAQAELFAMVERNVRASGGAIRVFTLGIGRDVSHAVVEGVARAGNGFAQLVGDNERMNNKVVRMLKAALSPHVNDYSLEVVYGEDGRETREESNEKAADDEEFELVEKVIDGLTIDVDPPVDPAAHKATVDQAVISLFSPDADHDVPMEDASLDHATAGGKFSHVPAIAVPRLLQAPHAVPPLHAFNRTTVYILLSPSARNKTPVAVVLRGRSQHGPLELRVPVTPLSMPGETVHQLAARRAVRELEDGRGWVFEARDRADGKLLRDKYPGRFDDMVQREAVRLGTAFRVAGKWTSFVTVEANGERVKTGEGEMRDDEDSSPTCPTSAFAMMDSVYDSISATPKRKEKIAMAQQRSMASAPSDFAGLPPRLTSEQRFAISSPFGSRASGPLFSPSHVQNGRALFGNTTNTSAFGAASSTSQPGGLFGNSSQPGAAVSLFGSNGSQPSSPPAHAGGLFASSTPSAPAHAQSGSLFGAQGASSGGGGLFASTKPSPTQPVSLFGDNQAASSGGLFASAKPVPPQPPSLFGGTQATSGGGLFGSANPVNAQSTSLFGSQASHASLNATLVFRASPSTGAFGLPPTDFRAQALQLQQQSTANPNFSVYRSTPSPFHPQLTGFPAVPDTLPTPASLSALDPLEALIRQQTFNGPWPWSHKVVGILGIERAAAEQRAKELGEPNPVDEVFATALVLVYLERHQADREAEWEMLADKARDWLRERLEHEEDEYKRCLERARVVLEQC